MPTILGANSVSGYDISNSLRFNDGDSPTLDKNFSSDGDRQKFTWSAWIKRSALAADMVPFGAAEGSGRDEIRLNSNDKFQVFFGDASDANLITTRVFRDVSAWYHFVVAVDTTQGTAANRIKVYVNGVQESAFDTETYPDQNYQMDFTADCEHQIGAEGGGSSLAFDGYIAEMNFVDGTQLTPSSFGETNDNNVWIPKLISGISYGTNGFFLEFKQTGTSANASGMGADTSGNNHHLTVGNLTAIDSTTDTPTNNFATMNPLLTNDGSTHSEGNTKLTTPTGPGISGPTIAMTEGKWYAEFICTAKGSVNMNVGIVKAESFDGNNQMDEGDNVGYMYQNNGNIFHGGADESYGASWAVDDIIGIAFNADNLNVEFFKNGAGQGNYTRIASENTGGDWFMCVGEGQGDATATFVCNFGNPAYTNSSSASDGKYGDFEYAPPSGYYALCTKRLAEFG